MTLPLGEVIGSTGSKNKVSHAKINVVKLNPVYWLNRFRANFYRFHLNNKWKYTNLFACRQNFAMASNHGVLVTIRFAHLREPSTPIVSQ